MSALVERLETKAYVIPTESPEADGTLSWNKTTLVVVEAASAGLRGLGYTFADTATAALIRDTLAERVLRRDAMNIPAIWLELARSVRNLGRPGIASMAISAIDMALWDLKGKLLNASVQSLLGASRTRVAAYGSGGFTSYSVERLQRQLADWASLGLRAVKMKIGTDPEEDLARVRAARTAVGPGVELFVDANGAYEAKQALRFAEQLALQSVSWFEEPVSSDDLRGLKLLRQRAPTPVRIAAGEYGYDLYYFRRMLESEAVDVLQVDATRCGGATGFLRAASLCEAFSAPLSAHTAPTLHAHLCCAAGAAINVEYFFDHARIEDRYLEGCLRPVDGYLTPDPARAGFGIGLREKEVSRYAA